MLDNISQVLNFFQEHEGIKLVNIGKILIKLNFF